MSESNNRVILIAKVLFAFTSVLLVVAVSYDFDYLNFFLRSFHLPILMVMYYMIAQNKSKMYLIAMLFASISNTLFFYSSFNPILIGLLAFFIFRTLILVQLYQLSEKIYFLPFVTGYFLLALPISYLYYITSETLGILFYIGLVNISINAFIGGISISNYTNQNSVYHTSLLVSSLFFVVLSVVFIIQKFFVFIPLNEPFRVVILLIAHYFYYLFLIQKENDT
jgi:hypothetical protein